MTKQERIDLLSDFKEMTPPEKEFQDVVKMMSKHCKTKETLAKIFRPTK